MDDPAAAGALEAARREVFDGRSDADDFLLAALEAVRKAVREGRADEGPVEAVFCVGRKGVA